MVDSIPSKLDEAGRCAALAHLLNALSDPVRLRILRELYRGEHCVGELCLLAEKRQQAISHHLTVLKLQGIVDFDRRKKSNVYRLTARGRAAIAVTGELAVA